MARFVHGVLDQFALYILYRFLQQSGFYFLLLAGVSR